jgi:hypothetical protein
MIGAMNAQARRHRATLSAIAVASVLAAPGCGFAVKHPAITAGIAGGTLGFTTCKLASDNWAACGYVAGGAGAFLGLVTAAALWLGGDGDSTGLDEPLPPLLEDGPPSSPPANPAPANPAPANPAPANPAPANPAPANPPPANPPPANQHP